MLPIMARVLVVGGAGYVGSATCAWLADAGHAVWILDNLSTGHRELVLGEGFTFGSGGDKERVTQLLRDQKIECVFHFAARSLVGESVKYPEEYHENNVLQTRNLLDAMASAGVRNLVFSSTCAIFGDPGDQVINEALAKNPISPYGRTKLEAEQLIEDYSKKHGLRSIALRYFNAAGAEPRNRVGEWHDSETHLIPLVLKAARAGIPIEIFGTDYPTPDGTCVRDYVHVSDLAEVHASAMKKVMSADAGFFEAYNLGSEKGFSVKEVLSTAEQVVGQKIPSVIKDRRPGDPPRLVADSTLAKSALGFKVDKGLKEIISTAWEWEKKRAQMLRPAIFLDRDGTLNEDPGYLSHPDQMKLLPHVGQALAELKAAGYLLLVISNQSGVRRGLVEESALPKIHDRLQELLKPWSVQLDEFSFCIHHPDEHCECRKPKPKLIHDAAKKFGIDLKRSYMVGDKGSDIGVGIAAGCKGSILVRTGEGAKTEKKGEAAEAAFIATTLLDMARWVLSKQN